MASILVLHQGMLPETLYGAETTVGYVAKNYPVVEIAECHVAENCLNMVAEDGHVPENPP